MRLRCGRALVLLSLAVSTATAPATLTARPDSADDLGHPSLRVFTDTDGLPVNSAMALEMDRQGYVWVATQDGAAYYNGREWTQVRMPESAGSNYVFDILGARDGSVWFATDGGGVLQWKDGSWLARHDTTSGLPSNATRTLLETSELDGGSIWVGTREGAAKLDGGKWSVFDSTNGLTDDRVRDIAEVVTSTGEREIWIATYGGISRMSASGWTRIGVEQGLPSDYVFTLLPSTGQSGETIVWAGTDGGLARFADGTWTRQTRDDGLPVDGVRSLLETTGEDGVKTLWAGTDNGGLARFRNGEWTVFDTGTWLPSNYVWDLLTTGDGDSSLWIGTLGGGVARLDLANWTTFDRSTGLPNDIVFSFLETDDGALWIGTYGGGVAVLEDGMWRIVDTSSGLPDTHIQTLLETVDSDGARSVWAGTERGLARMRNGRWTVYDTGDNLPSNEIWDLLETVTASGRTELWAATNGGLARFDGDQWQTVGQEAGLTGNRLRSLLHTSSDSGHSTLWVGSYNKGLFRFDGTEWTHFDTSNGFPSDRVLGMHATVDQNGHSTLWVATGGQGVVLLDANDPRAEPRTISSSTHSAILNDYIYEILEDRSGRIYLTTNKGVVRLTPTGAGGFSAYTYTTEDGLPSNECVLGASMVDSDGRVWVGTIRGAAVFDPSRESSPGPPRPLVLERARVAGQPRSFAPDETLTYDENRVQFDFALLSHFRERATRYRTQLVGLEDQPGPWTDSPSREFSYVPEGRYEFRVWGRDYAGVVSGPITVPFTVLPPMWRTWWAWILYALAIALAGAVLAYLVNRTRMRRLLELERVRTRIATDLHDDIGSSLSQIAVLSEVASRRLGPDGMDATEPLQRIADTSRRLVDSMSDVVWSINPNRDHLGDLTQRMRRFASDVLTAREIEFTMNVSEHRELRLDLDVKRQLFLIFKESIHNLLKHAESTHVTITLLHHRDRISMMVTDNGRGFDVGRQSDGNGLASMRSRAESLGGRFAVTSGPGGTAISVEVPLRPRADFPTRSGGAGPQRRAYIPEGSAAMRRRDEST